MTTVFLRTWSDLDYFMRPEMKIERVSYPHHDALRPCATENHVIPAFLEMVFDQSQNAMKRSQN